MNSCKPEELLKDSAPPSFDDVMIVPTDSNIRSRKDPDTTSFIASRWSDNSIGLELKIPLISSPMDTVTGSNMALSMSQNGGLGILHRFLSKEDQALMIQSLLDRQDNSGSPLVVPAVGVGRSEKIRAEYLLDKFEGKIEAFAVDVANGDSSYMRDMVEWINNITLGKIPIIAGNVATGDGFLRLAEAGASAVRVGIGGGSICKTRIMTGIGVPTLASVIDCHKKRSDNPCFSDVSIIADGGVRYPADFVKSLAAGADAVIAGRIFAGTLESPGELVSVNGVKSKVYRGMASKEVQDDKRGGLRPGTCAEGVSTHIPLKGKAHYVLEEFSGGLRSAMTYVNALNLSELRDNCRFIRVSESALNESHAFGTRK